MERKTPLRQSGASGIRHSSSSRTTPTLYRDAAPVANLIARLDAVRQIGPDRWTARCPAHDDRNPSLSVRETADGTVLLKCWAGCTALDIVQAVGLTLADLFPSLDPAAVPHRRRDPRAWSPMDALRCLSREGHIVLLAGEALARGETLDDADRARLAVAVGRLADALEQVGGMTR